MRSTASNAREKELGSHLLQVDYTTCYLSPPLGLIYFDGRLYDLTWPYFGSLCLSSPCLYIQVDLTGNTIS